MDDLFSIDPYEILQKHEDTIAQLINAHNVTRNLIKEMSEQQVNISHALVHITNSHNKILKKINQLELQLNSLNLGK